MDRLRGRPGGRRLCSKPCRFPAVGDQAWGDGGGVHLGLGGDPVAAGIAILRYRLYEIDRIINRTLVDGLLTALLGAVYAGTVLLLGQLFGGVGGSPPSWVIAGATLAVAALFQPARRRIQSAVDRRFNRRRYVAAKTVDAFSARLRDQIDLDTLTGELLTVVNHTVEPTAVSLWLRSPAPATGRSASQDREPLDSPQQRTLPGLLAILAEEPRCR